MGKINLPEWCAVGKSAEHPDHGVGEIVKIGEEPNGDVLLHIQYANGVTFTAELDQFREPGTIRSAGNMKTIAALFETVARTSDYRVSIADVKPGESGENPFKGLVITLYCTPKKPVDEALRKKTEHHDANLLASRNLLKICFPQAHRDAVEFAKAQQEKLKREQGKK